MTDIAVRPVPRISLSIDELAVSIGVSVNSIRAMVNEGALPQPRRWHTRQVFLIDEVVTAMQSWPLEKGTGPAQPNGAKPTDDEWRAVR